MLASSFHHWTSTSDSPRRANSTSCRLHVGWPGKRSALTRSGMTERSWGRRRRTSIPTPLSAGGPYRGPARRVAVVGRSEEHTSELQSRGHLVCRLLLEKKKKTHK